MTQPLLFFIVFSCSLMNLWSLAISQGSLLFYSDIDFSPFLLTSFGALFFVFIVLELSEYMLKTAKVSLTSKGKECVIKTWIAHE